MKTMETKTRYFTFLLDCPVLIAVILFSGIGGTFQHGFNVSVMASPSVFIKELVNTTCLQRYGVSLEKWQVSLIWSFTVSILSIGALLGSLVSCQLVIKLGRKKTLLIGNFVFITGAVLMVLSQTAVSFEMIIVGRFIYGVGSGLNDVAHVMYLVECAPKRLRAMMGVTISTFVSLGKFTGQLLGISELLGTRERWPWLLGYSGFTALLQLLVLPLLPESPSYLLMYKGDREACEQALGRLWGNKDYSRDLEGMLKEKDALQKFCSHSVMELIQSKEVRWQFVSCIIISCTMPLCGVGSVYFYASEVFHVAGVQPQHLRYAIMGMGLCEVFASLTCFMIVENTGKKVLLFRGYMGMAATLILLTIAMFLQNQVSWMPYCSMVLVFILITVNSIGPDGVSPAFASEILTVSFRSASSTILSPLHFVCTFLMGMVFPFLVEKLHYFSFLIFVLFCSVCALYVKFNVPETKNRTPLEIALEFQKMHGKFGKSQEKKSTEQKPDGNQKETKL